MSAETVIEVHSAAPYPVVIGRDVIARAVPMLGDRAQQVALISAGPAAAWAEILTGHIEASGAKVLRIDAPEGEAAKTPEFAARCWELLGDAAFTRTDAVVGVGGGAITDLSGFVAATWLRGVAHIAVPTTLLGMVDAAVGGKTGINTPQGKNLVGAFHEPAGVVCELASLASLPAADYAAGLAEVAKCGFIEDAEILRIIEAAPLESGRAGNPGEVELIRRAIEVKARVVAADLREATTPSPSGADGSLPAVRGREMLNYGHTFGHAVEQVEQYRWRHGDAISVGMVFVAELARAEGIGDESLVDRHRSVLSGLGLPTALPPAYGAAQFDALMAAMGRDKKTRGSTLRFIVLDSVGSPRLLSGPSEASLRRAYERVCS